MKHENSIKAELAEAYIRCFRAEKIYLDVDISKESYDNTKEKCYETLIENYSAKDILKMIMRSIRALEVTDNDGKIIEDHPLLKMPLESCFDYSGSNKGKSFTPDLPKHPDNQMS